MKQSEALRLRRGIVLLGEINRGLRADRDRLSWLEKHYSVIKVMGSDAQLVAVNQPLRAAIDNAMGPGPHQWHSQSPAAKAIDAAMKEDKP